MTILLSLFLVALIHLQHWPSSSSSSSFIVCSAFAPLSYVSRVSRTVSRRASPASTTTAAAATGGVNGILNRSSSLVIMSATNKPSGSFFHKVPDDSGDNDNDNNDNNTRKDVSNDAGSIVNSNNNNDSNSNSDDNINNNDDNNQGSIADDPFDQSIQQLIKSRKSKPLASSPSTMGGIPTSKVKGFGKTNVSPQLVTKVNTPGSKKPFIGIGKPLNDINRPEYDDQGYTLYANEETGEKSRVFEALVEYPSIFKLKIIGVNESSFSREMVQIVADSCRVDAEGIKYTERVNGKWLSVTVHAPVENAEMLYALYENVDKDPRVKFKF